MSYEGEIGCPINLRHVKNFVKADTRHLHFKNEAFEEAVSNHAIERIPNPPLVLDETLRVSRNSIVVRCPHRLGEKAPFIVRYNATHLWHFSMTWFRKFASIHKLKCRTIDSELLYLPHPFLSLIRLQYEITVEIQHVQEFIQSQVLEFSR
jgi:hypothetical protein